MTLHTADPEPSADWLGRLQSARAELPEDAQERACRALADHGASAALMARLRDISALPDDTAVRLLTRLFRSSFRFSSIAASAASSRLVLTGSSAAGKSSMTAKLAAIWSPAVRVFTTDIERPGGAMRLTEHLRALEMELAPLPSRSFPKAEALDQDARVIVDTAGVSACDASAVTHIAELASTMSAEIVLVASALADCSEALAMGQMARDLGSSRMLVTRLDMARRLGTVLTLAEQGFALCEASVTAHFAYGMKPLTPLLLAESLIARAL